MAAGRWFCIMTDDNEWVIVFYVDENGCSYVQEFLRGLDIKTQARFAWSIEQLRIRNIRAQEPLVRYLEGKLWEIREVSSTNIYRLLYYIFTCSQILFFNCFLNCSPLSTHHKLLNEYR